MARHRRNRLRCQIGRNVTAAAVPSTAQAAASTMTAAPAVDRTLEKMSSVELLQTPPGLVKPTPQHLHGRDLHLHTEEQTNERERCCGITLTPTADLLLEGIDRDRWETGCEAMAAALIDIQDSAITAAELSGATLGSVQQYLD
eukprot:9675690-Heterocapsa_arctica.AAC.1